jgi:uncharacterized heparinase superfamily protein
MRIEDRISGAFDVAEAWLHLHPDIDAQLSDATEVVLRWSPDEAARLIFEGAASVRVVESSWHPRFGVALASRCVVARLSGSTLTTRVCWEKIR